MKNKILLTVTFIFFGLWTSASMCTKVVTYADDYRTKSVTHAYSSNISIAMQQTQKAIESLGYQIAQADESRNQITTGWKPTKSDSHYMWLFQRRDYSGNSGAYYKLVADVFLDGPKVKVSVYTVVKSLAGKLKSSHVLENKVLKRLDDFMRSPQIEMTNVGVKER